LGIYFGLSCPDIFHPDTTPPVARPGPHKPNKMEKRQNNTNLKDIVVILLAWLVALSLVYVAFVKFWVLFH
jgi:hypothetical protein